MREFKSEIMAWSSAAVLLAFSSACGSAYESSNLDIVNGRTVESDVEPSVVFLYNPASSQDAGGGVCTGTFVKPQIMITAAHCTDYLKTERIEGITEETQDKLAVVAWDDTVDTDNDPSNGISGGYQVVAKSSRIFRPSSVNARNIRTVHTEDVAIIFFEDYESPETTNIASSSPRRGERATIVGFGADSIKPDRDDDSVGTKRMGTVRLSGIADFISFQGPSYTSCTDRCGEEVNAGPGDSGGPMFVDGELVATTSGGSFWMTSYVNVNSISTRRFIDAVEVVLDIEIND